MSSRGWIGVDLDGTLATYKSGQGVVIGEPIPRMVERVVDWVKAGVDVRVVTARAAYVTEYRSEYEDDDPWQPEKQISAIQAWCLKHIGKILPVTAAKDFEMTELWDDRAVRVERNTGVRLSPSDTGP